MKTAAPQTDTVLRAPTIAPIETMEALRQWGSLKEGANVARVLLAKRVDVPASAMPTLMGFDMGEFKYDPWFDQWSQGARGDSDTRSAANVYNFSFWQYVDISYYFGHQLLTIPPTVWTNAAHKNGVLSLGTLCLNWTENQKPKILFTEADVVDLLTENPTNPDKTKIYLEEALSILQAIATYYQFDGYLINFEDVPGVPNEQYRPGLLKLLSALNGNGLTSLWYDSPVTNGGVYANSLSPAQWDVFQASTCFQTNYWWGPWQGGKFKSTVPTLSWDVLRGKDPANALANRKRVFSGIYCSTDWKNNGSPPYQGTFFPAISLVQSQTNPPNFYTGLNLYYPAWVMYDLRPDNTGHNTDELPSRENFHNNDQAFWTGTRDLENYPIKHGKNLIGPKQCMKYYLQERLVVRSVPFVTWFNDGEGDFYNIEGETKSTGSWNNLSDQSILPTNRFTFDGGIIRKNNTTAIVHGHAFTGGSSLYVQLDPTPFKLDLFDTEIVLSATNVISLTVQIPTGGVNVNPVLSFNGGIAPVTVPFSKRKPLNNGWSKLEFIVPDKYRWATVTRIQLQLEIAASPAEFILGEFAFLDSSITPPKPPWVKPFPGNVTELDWSDSFIPSSHYRIYGALYDEVYLIGVAYNSIYRVKYGDAPTMTEADHIFNMNQQGFGAYTVQEVNAQGESKFVPSKTISF